MADSIKPGDIVLIEARARQVGNRFVFDILCVDKTSSAFSVSPDGVRWRHLPGHDTADNCPSCGQGLDSALHLLDCSKSEAVPCPEGFHWIGQSFASCDQCGLPAWEHAGAARAKSIASPFEADDFVLEPWKPGEAEAIRRNWERR